jgi:3-dehydroquinate synthase
MKTITIRASTPYSVLIETGCLPRCGQLTAQVFAPGRTAAVITDDTVSALYRNTVETSLRQAGFSVCSFVFPHGEDSKSHDTLLQVYDFLIEHNITRSDFLVALGGGVVGDLTGFAAATYLRGIPFVQIPTTFLAAIDSSVGGKTAVNIPAGKNLIGAFHQPSLVVCDPQTFSTLPPETFADGCAEMIKYALIWSEEFLSLLEQCDIQQQIEEIVARCVDIKRQVVEQDEHDCGIRMILNYGHTLGHAIEKVTNHAVTHGQGVAMGMVLITRLGIRMGHCDRALLQRLCAVLKRYHLPTAYHGEPGDLAQSCLHDKKRAGNTIRLILVSEPGKADLIPVAADELSRMLQEGLPC